MCAAPPARFRSVLLLALLIVPLIAASTVQASHFRGGSASWVLTSSTTLATVDPATGWIEIGGLGPDATDGVALVASDPDEPDAPEGGTRDHLGPVRWMAPESMTGRQYSSIRFGAEGILTDAVGTSARVVVDMTNVGDADRAAYEARLVVDGLDATQYTVRVRAFADGSPLFEESSAEQQNPLYVTATPPNTTTVLGTDITRHVRCGAVPDGCPPPLPPAADASGWPGGLSHMLTWDVPTPMTLFKPDGTPLRASVDVVLVTLEGPGAYLDRLQHLSLQWGVDDGGLGDARIVDVALGGLGVGAMRGYGAATLDVLVPADTRREELRIGTGAGSGGVEHTEELGRVKLHFPWDAGPEGLGPDGFVEFGIETLGADGLFRTTALRAAGEGTDSIVDFLLGGLPAPAVWEYENDGVILAVTEHPPDPILPDLPKATSVELRANGAQHVYAHHFAPPVLLSPAPGAPLISVDTVRVIGNVGEAAAEGAKAIVRIGAGDLPSGELRVTGASPSYAGQAPGVDLSGLNGAGLVPDDLGSHIVRRVGSRDGAQRPVHRQSLPPSVAAKLKVAFPPSPAVHFQPDRSALEIKAEAVALGGDVALDDAPAMEVVGHEAAHVVQSKQGRGSPKSADTVTFLRYENGTLVDSAVRMHGEDYAFDFPGSIDEAGVLMADVPGEPHRVWITMAPSALSPPGPAVADRPALAKAAPLYLEMQTASDPGQFFSLVGLEIGASGVPWIRVGEAEPLSAVHAPPAVGGPTVRMHPAAPNPFNPRTAVVLESTSRREARVGIHDLRGRLVDVLFDGVLDAGATEIVWDGTDRQGRAVASGVYLLRLVDADGSTLATAKVALVR